VETEKLIRVVQIRLREAGRVHYFRLGDIDLSVDEYCIVQSDRGQEYGQVMSEPETVPEENFKEPLKMVLRKITINDRYQINKNLRDGEEARRVCLEKIHEHNLPMKLVDVEYSFDRSKIVFYFTSDGRVDFRDLVKDLARHFRSRIELRQIGVRDEAKMVGGLGCCGRPLCCTTFLRNFEPINIRMAKDQRLSLNPSKISGVCGRLLCCLRYEHSCYVELSKGLPRLGAIVATSVGEGTVIEHDPLQQQVRVLLSDGREIKLPGADVKVLRDQPMEEEREPAPDEEDETATWQPENST
jgi:cell fate regulator YaaT (PSP1 superfamily)